MGKPGGPTQLKPRGEAPRDDAAQLRLIADNVPAMSIAYDENLRCLFANRRFAEFFGFTTVSIVGKHLREIIGEGPYQEIKPYFDRVLEGRPTSYKRARVLDSGELRYLEVELIPHIGHNGRVQGLFAVTTDVTERKREEQLRILGHSVANLIADADSSTAAIQAVIRAICETERWDCGRYFQPSAPDGALRLVEAWGIEDPGIQKFLERSWHIEYAPGIGLIGEVWQSGEAVWVADLSKDGRALRKAYTAELLLGGTFLFPVKSQGAVIGVLSFNSRETRAPDERLLQAILAIGSQIGQFLERKRAEEQLRESEARFRSLTQLSSDWYWEQDSEFRVTFISRELREKTGLDTSAFIGSRSWDQPALNLTEKDWARFRDMLERHQAYHDFEIQRPTGAGRSVWLCLSGEPVFDPQGTFKGYRGIGRDITERKRAEQLLRMEHSVTRCLAEATSMAAGLTGVLDAICKSGGWECGRYFGIDEAAGVMRLQHAWHTESSELDDFIARTGDMRFSPGAGLTGRVWQSGGPLWAPDLRTDPRVFDSTTFEKHSLIRSDFEFPVVSEGQTIGVISVASRVPRDPDERLMDAVRVIGSQVGQFVARNSAEARRRLAEQAIKDSEARFRRLTELSSDWYWEQDAELRFVATEGATDARGGITPAAHIGKRRWELPSTEIVNQTWDEHKALLAARQPFRDLILRRTDSSGKVHFVAVAGEPMFDAKRAFCGYRGVASDVTDRVRAEDGLRESEARFRSLCALSSDLFWEQDAQYRFTTLSDTSGKIDRDQLLGKTRWEQDYTNLSEEDWAAHKAVLDAHMPFRDLELCRLDTLGAEVWYSVSGEPVCDASGAFAGYRGVGRNITERKLAEKRIRYLANHDALTGLPNRTSFSDVLNASMQNARRHERSLAVMFVDLDRFKVINDTLGHEAGDQLLREVGTRLRHTLRASDVIARLGGDEFVVLVQEVKDTEQVEAVARKILAALVKPMFIQGHEYTVTASTGICFYPADAEDEQSLMKNADTAMYRAKEAGRNNYKFYSGESNSNSVERFAMETRLRRGLERNEFFLHYQPRVNLKSGAVTGVEALVRWQHPELGSVPPGQFITLAEETGIILELGT